MIAGGCLCGAVRYEIEGEATMAFHCHCRHCQRASGSGHAPLMAFAKDAVTSTGETKSYAVQADSGQNTIRQFCPNCGSHVFGIPEIVPGIVTIFAGTLDDPNLFVPQMAVYTRSRPIWDQPTGELPAFETFPSET